MTFTAQAPTVGAVDFEQLVMTWSRRNLERVPGFAVAAHSTNWPAEVGRRFEDFGSVGRFLRQGWTRVAALGHELPVSVFWGPWRETGWEIYGCKRHCGRDGEGRPGNYLVHILATRQGDIPLRSRVAAWDAPFLARYDDSYSARKDLPALRVYFDVLDAAPPPPQIPDAERILAACCWALERGERLPLVAGSDAVRREFLSWLSCALPLQLLDDAAVSTFESDLSRKDLDLILLDRSYSDVSRNEPSLFIDLDNPQASIGLDSVPADALRVATTLLSVYPAQADSGTFATLSDLMSYLTAVAAVGSLRRLHDDEIQGVLAIAKRGRTPLTGGRGRETVLRVISSDELAKNYGDDLIDLIEEGRLSLEPGLDWSFVEEILAAGAVGSTTRWRVVVRLVQALGVGQHMTALLLGASRRRLVDLSLLPAQRVLGVLRPTLYDLERTDFEHLAAHMDLYSQLVEDEDFALAALASLAQAGSLRSAEFQQIAVQHGALTAQILAQLLEDGVPPTPILEALLDLDADHATQIIDGLPLGFGVVADYLELPEVPTDVAFAIVRGLWPARADLLGVTPRMASFLVVDDGLVRDLLRRSKRGMSTRRKGATP